jgi:hypothetical protein
VLFQNVGKLFLCRFPDCHLHHRQSHEHVAHEVT